MVIKTTHTCRTIENIEQIKGKTKPPVFLQLGFFPFKGSFQFNIQEVFT